MTYPNLHVYQKPSEKPVKVLYSTIVPLLRENLGLTIPPQTTNQTGPEYLELLEKYNQSVRRFEADNGIDGSFVKYTPYPADKDYAFESDYVAAFNKVTIQRLNNEREYLKSWLGFHQKLRERETKELLAAKSKKLRLFTVCGAVVLACAILAVVTRYKVVIVDREGMSAGQEVVKVDRWTGKAKRMYTTQRY